MFGVTVKFQIATKIDWVQQNNFLLQKEKVSQKLSTKPFLLVNPHEHTENTGTKSVN